MQGLIPRKRIRPLGEVCPSKGGSMPRFADERRSHMHIRALMAQTSEGLIAIGPDGDVRVFNETAQEMLGKSRGEIVGKPYTSLGQPGERPHYHPGYYCSYLQDPDHHNLETVYHDRT